MKVVHVAAAVVKAITGTARPNEKIERARMKACRGCPKYSLGRCRFCGCIVALKIRVESEKCPLGKWP
jgi:hypothetical protein